VSWSVIQSVGQSVSRPVSQSVSRPVSQSVSIPVSRSVSKSVGLQWRFKTTHCETYFRCIFPFFLSALAIFPFFLSALAIPLSPPSSNSIILCPPLRATAPYKTLNNNSCLNYVMSVLTSLPPSLSLSLAVFHCARFNKFL